MTGIFIKALMKGASKVSPTIKSVSPSKRNKIFGEQKEKISKTVDKFSKGVDKETKIKMRGGTASTLGKISRILKGENVGPGSSNPKRPGKKDGGRMGLKRGTGLMKKKSNVQKIKETFGPKNKSTKFGMLSVKAGIDKNPNPTQADRIAGAKMKNKKRFV